MNLPTGGSRSATGQSSHSSGDDSDLLGKHVTGDNIASTSSSSSSGNSSFLRERLDPIVEAEERALEALRKKFARVDIEEGFGSAASTPGSRAGSVSGSRTSAWAGDGGKGGLEVRLPSPQKQTTTGAAAVGSGLAPYPRGRGPIMTRKESFDDSDDDEERYDAEGNYVSSSDEEDSLNAATAATEDSDGGRYPSSGQLDKYMEQIYMGDKKARRR